MQRDIRSSRFRGLALAIVLGAVVFGCGSESPAGGSGVGAGRITHEEGAGALSGSVGSGEVSIAAPGAMPWSGSFGSLILCSRHAADIRLDGVRFQTDVKPIAVKAFVRTVEPGQYRGELLQSPIGSAYGTPPGFDEPYADRKMKGSFTESIEGIKILHPCADADKSERGYQELVVNMRVGREGGRIKHTLVNYTSGAKRFTLRLGWVMTVCGSSSKLAPVCD